MIPQRLQGIPQLKRSLPQWLPRLSVLDHYILAELLKPFLFGVGAFSAIGLSAGVLFDLLERVTDTRLPLPLALQILGLQMPYFISLSFPMATLLASLLCFARLSADGELTALKAGGISLYRLLSSVLIFALLVTGLTFAFTEGVVPATQHQAKQLLRKPLAQGYPGFESRNIFYQEYGEDQEIRRFFYAQKFDGEAMQGLTVLDFTRPGANQVIAAESALWDEAKSTWTFKDGTIYVVTADGADQSVLEFPEQRLRIPRDPLELAQPKRSAEEMNIAEAQQYVQVLRPTGDAPRIRKLEIQIQQKYSTPCVGLVFGLIGSTLGMRPRRLSTSTGFGICLLIVLGHYFLTFLTDSLGNLGVLSPISAAWLPNLLVGGLGIGLLVQRAR